MNKKKEAEITEKQLKQIKVFLRSNPIFIFFAVLILTILIILNFNTPSSNQKLNLDDVYGKITIGMSEAQVETIITHEPTFCSESEMPMVGNMKLCSYGNVFIDSGSIMVTYTNDRVYSKTKSQF